MELHLFGTNFTIGNVTLMAFIATTYTKLLLYHLIKSLQLKMIIVA